MNLQNYLQTQTKKTVSLLAVGLAVLVGGLDYWSGPQLSFTLFYLLPVAVSAWFVGPRAGASLAFFCAILMTLVAALCPLATLPLDVEIWNAAIRCGIFLVLALVMDKLKTAYATLEQQVAERTASLTAEITKRQQAEAAAKLQFAQVAMDKMLDAAYWVRADGRFVYANETACRLLGYTRAELLELGVPAIDANLPARQFGQIWRELQTEKHRVFETHHRTKAGQLFPVELTVSYLENDGTGYLCGIARDLTARRQTEAALRDSEQKYRRLHESSRDAFVRVDMQGHLLEFNPAYQDLLGYSAAELRQLSYVEITPARWHALEAQIVADQILPLGHSEIYEKEYRRKDGTILPVEMRTVLLRDAAGQPSGMWAIVRDITLRKQVEATLRENEERLRAIVDNSIDLIYRRNMQTDRYDFFSPSVQPITGYSSDELVGTSSELALTNVHPTDRPQVEALLHQTRTGALSAGSIEYRFRHKDGCYRWLSDRFSIQKDATGQPLYWLGVSRDVTLKKELEQAVRQNEDRLRRLLEHSPDAVSIVDAKGQTIWTTAAATRLLGYTPEEFAQRPIVEWVHPDDLKQYHALQIQTLAEPGTLVSGVSRLRHKNGSWRWIEGHATNLLADPSIGGIIINYRDITERQQIAAALQDSELRYRTLFEQAADAIVVFDPQTLEFRDFNQEACQRLGYTREEFAQLKISDIDLFEDPAAVRRRLNIPYNSTLEFETKQRTKTGAVLDIIVRTRRLHIGSTDLAQAIWTDMTERNRIQMALRDEQEKLALAVAGSDGAQWEIPMDPRQPDYVPDLMIVSPRLKGFIGFRDDEFPNSIAAWFARIHPEDVAAVRAQSAAHLAGHVATYGVEFRIQHRDGSWHWLASHGRLFRDRQGQPLRWCGIDWDITGHKQVEAVLRRSQAELEQLLAERTQRLEQTQQWLQKIYDSSQDAIVISEITGRILEFNHAFETLLGYSAPEIRTLTFEQLTPPEFRELNQRIITQISRTGETARFEKEYFRKDGTRVPVALTLWLIHDHTGQFTKLAAIVSDVTEQHRLQREILEVSEHERRRIGQDLHDSLCQMLTATTFAVGSLEERLARDNPPAAQSAHEIGELIRRANGEARNISRGLYPVELEAGGLIAALQRLADDVTRAGKARCEFIGDPDVVVANPMQALHIYRITQEAVANALRHGAATTIVIVLKLANDQVFLEVANNGRDWPLKLAEPGHSLGMGLTIMAYRARMIGGALQVCRGNPGGTMVELSFPILRSS